MDYATRILAAARIKLTGVLDDAVRLSLFDVLDDFCQQTNAWQESILVTTVAPGGPDVIYDLIPDEGTPLRLMDFRYEHASIGALATMAVPGELMITSPHTVGDKFLATISLTVIDPVGTNNFPVTAEWFWARYYQAFIDGIIMKMAAEQDKPYSNPSLVGFHGARFRVALGVARADTLKANMADGQAWRFPAFA